jgi:hypothetical protein
VKKSPGHGDNFLKGERDEIKKREVDCDGSLIPFLPLRALLGKGPGAYRYDH